MKDVQDLFPGNYETLQKEFKEDLSGKMYYRCKRLGTAGVNGTDPSSHLRLSSPAISKITPLGPWK